MPVLDGREAPHELPGPPTAAQAGQDVVTRLSGLAGHDADAARQRGPRQLLLRREQPFGVQTAPELLELGQQVALTGDAQAGDLEREAGRGGPGAGVVVAPTRHDDLRTVGERADPQLVEVLPPHRARQRAGRIAQLEPHLGPPGLEAEHLTEHLHAREPAQPVPQLRRIGPDGIRPREDRTGDAVRRVHCAHTLAGGQDASARWIDRVRSSVIVRRGGVRPLAPAEREQAGTPPWAMIVFADAGGAASRRGAPPLAADVPGWSSQPPPAPLTSRQFVPPHRSQARRHTPPMRPAGAQPERPAEVRRAGALTLSPPRGLRGTATAEPRLGRARGFGASGAHRPLLRDLLVVGLLGRTSGW